MDARLRSEIEHGSFTGAGSPWQRVVLLKRMRQYQQGLGLHRSHISTSSSNRLETSTEADRHSTIRGRQFFPRISSSLRHRMRQSVRLIEMLRSWEERLE